MSGGTSTRRPGVALQRRIAWVGAITALAAAVGLVAVITTDHPTAGGEAPTPTTIVSRTTAPPGSLHVPPNKLTLPLHEVTDQVGLGGVAPMYGRGVAAVDLDGDGAEDLFLADTDNGFRKDGSGGSLAFHNVGGRYEPWDLGIDRRDLTMNGNASFADADGDGDPDLVLLEGNNTGEGHLSYYENRVAAEGRFVRRTDAGLPTRTESWWGASWLDLELDGDLDLVLTGFRPYVLVNDGHAHFRNRTGALGIAPAATPLHNPVILDIDDDGDQDLFIAGIFASRLYRNDRTRLVDVTSSAFSARTLDDYLDDDFSAASADFDQDGHEDLWLGRWWYQDVVLFGRGDGTFEQHDTDLGIETLLFGTNRDVAVAHSVEADLTPDEGSENTMGLLVADLDANGYPDALIGPGDPSRENPYLAFCGFPDPKRRVRFERCSEPMRSALGKVRGHGAAVTDLDHDGVDDLVISRGGFPPWDERHRVDTRETPAVFAGDAKARGHLAHVTLLLQTGAPALGARVAVRGADEHHATVQTTQGFQSQSSARLQLVVGDGAEITVTWPGGAKTTRTVEPGDDVVLRAP